MENLIQVSIQPKPKNGLEVQFDVAAAKKLSAGFNPAEAEEWFRSW